MRVGAVDCGTNSIRLLVADLVAGPRGMRAQEVTRRMEIVRLGAGIDASGTITPEALERTFAVCREYAAECDALGAGPVRFAATSASRDARNADEFVAGVARAFAPRDVRPEVVDGLVEAELSFTGATADLGPAGVPGPYLVVDLGGGSTEFVRGTDGHVAAAVSVDIGCVRLHERHVAAATGRPTGAAPWTGHDDEPMGPAAVDAILADVDAALDRVAETVDLTGLGALVGLAGTVTTLAAAALDLAEYDRAAIHLSRHTPAAMVAAARDLAARTPAQRARLGYVHPGRADVLGAGALVWARIVERVARGNGADLPVVVSEHDILDGLALSLAGPA